jgi:hypothetical protein
MENMEGKKFFLLTLEQALTIAKALDAVAATQPVSEASLTYALAHQFHATAQENY